MLICLGVLTGLWVTARITGALQWYVCPTTANEPTIKVKQHIFTSNLISPQLGDLICYYKERKGWGEDIYVHRLCGTGEDTVLIKDGILFVNGENLDKNKVFNFAYIVPTKSIPLLKRKRIITEGNYYVINEKSIIFTNKETVEKDSIQGEWRFEEENLSNDKIMEKWNQPWNTDYFGPVVVPLRHYFVMGDSRHNSLDSRYFGFIPVENFAGTVVGY